MVFLAVAAFRVIVFGCSGIVYFGAASLLHLARRGGAVRAFLRFSPLLRGLVLCLCASASVTAAHVTLSFDSLSSLE